MPVASLIHNIPRSCASDPPATDQPWCSSPTRFSTGTSTSVKKTSLKSACSLSVSSARGRVSMPGVRHVDDEHADAGVLGGVGIGAHEAEAVVGVVGARGPHLLAVHDEAVPVELGPGAQAGQVAAGVGLAHAQAPADLGAQGRAARSAAFCSSVP